ncbi:S1 domain-containing RNA-binding protein [Geosporobacter ferrireducens]|uniref:RNA-binding protein S1 n=1 Tax=Geosporobacter ferrireducens TaxID=1424294 RepID=A0A1D8GJH5_9FIRM|nr:S1 domain-containing RNA-binding protein [Geosporobacter ferrireducens]AOT71068.1 RNA-binding protein S1 [Geosporobacter ferrireducens]MTI58295.1 RNA-binding protein S1 [Geosporobacter ferrireducens]
MPVEIGKVIEGTVTGITNFGAFIQLPEGKTGLCHISEVADDYVKNIHNYLKEQQKVKVKVISVDGNGKISLSIRQAQVKPPIKSSQPMQAEWQKKSVDGGLSFEDKLSKFLKDSDEKQQQLKKHSKDNRKGNGKGNGVNNRKEIIK